MNRHKILCPLAGKPEKAYFTSGKSVTIELLALLLFYWSREAVEKQTEKARGGMWTPSSGNVYQFKYS